MNRRAFMSTTFPVAGGLLAGGLTGCISSMDDLSPGDVARGAKSAYKVGKAVAKTFEDITPEQEYYIGRAVSATVLTEYTVYDNRPATRYVNVLGKSVAMASTRPETFGGYHFQILDSDEINAFAAPSGFVLLTRGLVKCCETEDALAAVLAHEVAHVELSHGLRSIKKSRLTNALSTIAMESASLLGPTELASVTDAFGGSIQDITNSLVVNGYSRSYESDADETAVKTLRRVGYDPNGLADMLDIMKTRLTPGGPDFAKTHPDPADRLAAIELLLGSRKPVINTGARKSRFQRFIAAV